MIKKWVMKRVEELFNNWAREQGARLYDEFRIWKQTESVRAESFRVDQMRHEEQVKKDLDTLVKLITRLSKTP